MINQPLVNNIPDEASINPCLVSLQMQLDAANKRIAELENQWISVEDRLPEDDSFVVAAYHYGFTCDPDAAVCDFYNGGFQLNTDGLDAENHDGVATITMDFKVTHWMPLPKPPKEQGE